MASIVVAGDTSGTVTLAAPSVAGTTTLTLPTANGTLITTGSSGQSIPRAALPAGSVLQVVSASKTDTASLSSSSWTDITGLSVSITPTSSSSRFLILSSISTGSDNAAQFYRMVRDSTVICVGTSVSSREPVSLSNQGMQANGNAVLTIHQNFLDSPATASAITYKMQWRNQGGTIYINRSAQDTDNNNFARAVSTITVMEIAA